MERISAPYSRALIPAALFACLALPGLGSLKASAFLLVGVLFIWGLAAGLAYVFVFNRIETRRHQKIFLVFSAFALPFIGYGLLIGGLLGPVGIIINSGAPLLALLIFVGGVLHKEQGLRLRAALSLTVFALLLSGAIWGVRRESARVQMEHCIELRFGSWDAEQRRCEVEPAQAIRNAIFFSHASLPGQGLSISFSNNLGERESPHGAPGDLLGVVYQAGQEVGAARYQADLALEARGFVIVPVVLEEMNSLQLFSLRRRFPEGERGLFGDSTELAGAMPLTGLEAVALSSSGDTLTVTVLQDGGERQDMVLALAPDGTLSAL